MTAMRSREWIRLHALGVELRQLLRDADLMRADAYMQHGDTTCLMHMIAVAYLSMLLMEGLRLHYHRRALLRGALLHDLFLYDWHDPNHPRAARRHAFSHAGIALNNARRCVEVSELEADIIARHMFPVTLTPPRSREAAVVCLADKLCALHETLHRRCYGGLRRTYDPLLRRAAEDRR